ncbi:MAG: FtsX-like permease family protein [Desulfobacter sp.]|nr:FtsX-like permease family protein [Desulfobacter sp.]
MKLHNISLGNIKRRKGKMLFLALGLIIGISTIVTLLAITETMTAQIEERLNKFGANIVMVPKTDNLSLNYGGIDVGGVNYEVREFHQKDLQKIHTIQNAKNLGVVTPKILGPVVVAEKRVLLMGVIFDEELALKTWWQKKGKFPDNGNQVLLGASVASILGKEARISMVEIAAFCRGCPITELTLQIAQVFPNAKVTAMKQAVMSKMQSIEMFKSFSLGISVLVIGIGALLVMVTMMGSVNERTREIGIFRAIGFRQTHVMQIILLEALVLGIFGGIVGFLLGNLAAWAIIPLVIENGGFAGVNFKLGGISLLMAASLSLLASLYPAFKAGRMDPSDALRAL